MENADKTNAVSNSELIRRYAPTGLAETDSCVECNNNTFAIHIDTHGNGVLYECTECGYVHTQWFGDIGA